MSRPERTSGAECATSRPSLTHADRSAGLPRETPQPCYEGDMVTRAVPRSRPRGAFNGVKVFSATKFAERGALGDRVTDWLRERPELQIVDMVVTQSSDAEFHCVTISVFYFEQLAHGRVDR